MTRLRVASWNIHHGADGSGRLDLARTARTLAGLDADVIGLQEVDVRYGARSRGEDQAARLGELLGMQVAFGAAIDRPGAPSGPDSADGEPDDDGSVRTTGVAGSTSAAGSTGGTGGASGAAGPSGSVGIAGASDPGPSGRRAADVTRRRYGNAVLSRHGLLDPAMHLLGGHPALPGEREPRGVLSSRVQLPGGPQVTVLVTHLDTGHRGHRAAQVQGILRLTAAEEGPMVLIGDVNADPAAPEFAALAASGWREAGTELTGRSATGAGPRLAALGSVARAVLPRGPVRATWPARFPLRRLDALWLRGAVRPVDLQVVPSTASDHRPLLATLELG